MGKAVDFYGTDRWYCICNLQDHSGIGKHRWREAVMLEFIRRSKEGQWSTAKVNEQIAPSQCQWSASGVTPRGDLS